jgi:hypothetical protein
MYAEHLSCCVAKLPNLELKTEHKQTFRSCTHRCFKKNSKKEKVAKDEKLFPLPSPNLIKLFCG